MCCNIFSQMTFRKQIFSDKTYTKCSFRTDVFYIFTNLSFCKDYMWYLVQRKRNCKQETPLYVSRTCWQIRKRWNLFIKFINGFIFTIASNKVLRFAAHQADIAACLDPCSVENQHSSLFSLSLHSSLFHPPKIHQAQENYRNSSLEHRAGRFSEFG